MSEDKNKVKYVVFDPVAVGWDKGFEGAIRDAKNFGVPLAVKSLKDMAEIRLRHQPEIEIILVE